MTILIHLLTVVFINQNYDQICADMSLLSTGVKNAAIANTDTIPTPNGWAPINITNSPYTSVKPKIFNKPKCSCVSDDCIVSEVDKVIT